MKVTGITAPAWVTAEKKGKSVTLTAAPEVGGCYFGDVVIHTNANDVILTVCTESTAFNVPPDDEVWLNDLVTPQPGLDLERSRQLLEAQLLRLGFNRLPGGVFVRRVSGHGAAALTTEWWLTALDLRNGQLPAFGYPASFTVFAEGQTITSEVTCQAGQLGGELINCFELLEAKAGQRFTLTPYQGGYKAALSPAEPWRTAQGHTFWLQGSWAEVQRHPEVLETLIRRGDESPVTLNVLLYGEATLPPDLLRQHRAGRLSIRWSREPLPYRLVVCGDEGSEYYVPPVGRLTNPAHPPTLLWEAAAPHEGRDYREQSRQRGVSGEPLLNLKLSVQMEQLASALRVCPQVTVPLTPRQREKLHLDLPQQAAEMGFRQQPLHAAKLLRSLRLTPEQVAAGATGVRITQGGYLVPPPQDFGNLDAQCRYVAHFYGGIIHHSQLRKLVEAFKGRAVDPVYFVVRTLEALGWAGNGYRRPKEAWEPTIHELTPFTLQVLTYLKGDRVATLGWLRRRVAATEAQLDRALHKAETQFVAPPPARVAASTPAASPPTSSPKKPLMSSSGSPARPPTMPIPTPVPAPRPSPRFHPLRQTSVTLPDPRRCPQQTLLPLVTELIRQEGPLTESWLVRRYAALSKVNVKQVRSPVVQAAVLAELHGDVVREGFADGHVEFSVASHPRQLRERGERQAEDITLHEWCELLRALGVASACCDEQQAYEEAARAYRLGNAAAGARPLIRTAYQQVLTG